MEGWVKKTRDELQIHQKKTGRNHSLLADTTHEVSKV